MTIDEAKAGLKYLSVNFPTMKLDWNDSMVVAIWSKPFRNLTFTEFRQLIEKYCERNTVAPNCPMALAEPIRDSIRGNMKSPSDAWRYTIVTLSDNDFLNMPNRAGMKLSQPCRKVYEELRGDFLNIGMCLGDMEMQSNVRLKDKFEKLYSKYAEGDSLEETKKLLSATPEERKKLNDDREFLRLRNEFIKEFSE